MRFCSNHCLQLKLTRDNQALCVPDILLNDNKTYKTLIIIEVCHPNGLNNNMKKTIRFFEENDYHIAEGFIYDYVREKYKKGIGQVLESKSYSDILLYGFSEVVVICNTGFNL